jgi:EAL domain-containing protein (putative c-di-GMP-specific phosphodiesterase class I)
LKLVVIAEGAETKEQVDLLRTFGCNQVQGYFFYKPLPADEIETLLRAQEEDTPT